MVPETTRVDTGPGAAPREEMSGTSHVDRGNEAQLLSSNAC